MGNSSGLEDSLDLSTDVLCRAHRDRLLLETDWWVLTDSPTATSEQLAYRQALRDIPAQAGFPDSISWPTRPT